MDFVPISDFKIKIEPPGYKSEDQLAIESVAIDTREIIIATDDIYTGPFTPSYDAEDRGLEQLATTIEQLFAFSSSVKKYGLTRSLISFADYNRNLSGAIKEIPSLESLLADRSVSKSTDVVAAVEASIADAISIFVRKLKARFKNLITRITTKTDRLDAVALHIKTLKDMMDEGRICDENLFKKKTFKNLMNRRDLFSSFQDIVTIEAFIHKISTTSFPTDKESYESWFREVKTDFDHIGKEINIVLRESCTWDILKEDDDEYTGHVPRKPETLEELGYKIEDFDRVVDEFLKGRKILPKFTTMVMTMSSLLRNSANHESEKYLQQSARVYCNVVNILADFSGHILDTATVRVLKAIFSCTKKK